MLRLILVAGCVAFAVSPAHARPVADLADPTLSTGLAKSSQALDTTMRAALLAGGFGRVTSIFRTAAHNRDVGGVPNSYHLRGRALDVARKPGVSHLRLAMALQRAGYKLVESLDEGDHSHFAFAASPVPEAPSDKLVVAPVVIRNRLAADDHGILLVSVANPNASSHEHIFALNNEISLRDGISTVTR